MAVLINFTADKYQRDPYIEKFSKYGPVYFGYYKKNNEVFFDGTNLNFKITLPSHINNDSFIEYAENLNKDTEEIYSHLRKSIFDRYCYYLTRASGSHLGGIYEYLYYFRLHIRAAVRFLDDNKIDFMFMATPSMGFDNVLYEVSKLKK